MNLLSLRKCFSESSLNSANHSVSPILKPLVTSRLILCSAILLLRIQLKNVWSLEGKSSVHHSAGVGEHALLSVQWQKVVVVTKELHSLSVLCYRMLISMGRTHRNICF